MTHPPERHEPTELRDASLGGRCQRLRVALRTGSGPRWREGLAAILCLLGLCIFAVVLHRVYPIQDWLVWDLCLIWFYVLLFTAACVAAGAWVLQLLLRGEEPLPSLEGLVQSFVVGVVLFALCMYAGGFLRLLSWPFALALPLLLILGGARAGSLRIRLLLRAWRSSPLWPSLRFRPLRWVLWGSAGTCLLLLGVAALTPDSFNYDAIWYHVPIAETYAREGRIVPFPGDFVKALPHLTSLLHTWAYLVPGLTEPGQKWILLLQNEFAIVLWTMAGVAAGAQWILGNERIKGLWMAFLLFPGIHVYDQHIGGAADHVLALFAVPLFLGTVRAVEAFSWRYCALLGALAAGALLTKYQAAYVVGGCTVLLGAYWIAAWHRRGARPGQPTLGLRQLLGSPLVGLGIFVLLSSPHFLKNVAFHGNPVYPFLQDLFPGSHPSNAEALEVMPFLFTDYYGIPQGGPLRKVGRALRLAFTFSFYPHYSFTRFVPVVGSLFTLLLPIGLVLPGAKRIWIGGLVGFVGLVIWGYTYLADRYLQAVIPLLAAVVAALLVRIWELGTRARAALIPLVALQIVWSGDALVYSACTRLWSAMTLLRNGFEGLRQPEQRYAFRKPFTDLDLKLPKDAVLVEHHERISLGINRPVLLDGPGKQGLINYADYANTREVWEDFRRLGVTHLLILPSVLPNLRKIDEVLFLDLFYGYGVDRIDAPPVSVARLPDHPPPFDSAFEVLSLGTTWSDGLYAVQQLRAYDVPEPFMPGARGKRTPPKVVWPTTLAGRAAMIRRSDAIVHAPDAMSKLGPALLQVINARFHSEINILSTTGVDHAVRILARKPLSPPAAVAGPASVPSAAVSASGPSGQSPPR